MIGRSHLLRHGCSALVVAAAAIGVLAWTLAPAPAGRAQDTDKPEISSQDTQPAYHLRVQHNEVVVRVVVRDSKGQVVRNLTKDDFRVFDNKQPEIITHFAAEGAAVQPRAKPADGGSSGNAADGSPATAIVLPSRFTALFFDDVHLQFGDLAQARKAAGRYIDKNLGPGDRMGIYTSSGQNQVDFTDDRDKLHADLNELKPRPIFPADPHECPPLTPYQAYRVIHEHDEITTQAAEADAYICHCQETGRSDPQCPQEALQLVQPAALRIENQSEDESHYSLDGLRRLCQRMSGLPGQQTMVLVSPGFLTINQLFDVSGIVDLALRQSIVISTLDARGLYTIIPGGDATERTLVITSRPDLQASKALNQDASTDRESDVLESLAFQTGGFYFHNSNDLDDGFRRAASFPEAFYLLTFAPVNLKLDGRLHTLKVTLTSNPNHDSVQARRGYFAPTKPEDLATVAKEELEQMVFSQDESQTIPLQIHTQYFQADGAARISVLAHVDVSGLRFRKAQGRNLENLTVVTALFDRQGNYVTAEQKRIEFRLLDATLNRLNQTGLSMKASLAVKPGTYLVREVVQESEGGQISASNSQVEIP